MDISILEKTASELSAEFKDHQTPPRLQIHFGGSQRAGKTVQAKIATQVLQMRGCNVIPIDVDKTRATIFSTNEPAISGTPCKK